MTIGELNRRIEILELVEERDSYGAVVGDWVTTGRVWAKIEPLQGSEKFLTEQVEASQQYKITVRFYAGLSLKHRIKYLDKVLDITGIKDITTAHRWTEITAKELIDGLQR